MTSDETADQLPAPRLGVADAQELELLLDYLKRSRGFDFTGYKRASLLRRILKRMQQVGIEGFGAYLERLEVEPAEFAELFNTILINVTGFFRDPVAWEHLATNALAPALAHKSAADPIRVSSVGCASGEEAYTLAMVLAEHLGESEFKNRVKIYAADIDENALVQARLGSYTAKQVEDMPPPLVERYFEQFDGRFVFRKDLRRAIIFGRHDLLQDPPISRIDLLVCRNVLMYFNAAVQKKVLGRFYFALNMGGLLFLGRAETMLTQSNAFRPVDLKQRIFSKVPRPSTAQRRLVLMAQAGGEAAGLPTAGVEQLRMLTFDADPHARILVDSEGIIALINERARGLFALSEADLGRPLHDLELSYRPAELRSLIDQAYAEHRPTVLNEVEWTTSNARRWFDVIVDPLFGLNRQAAGASISFFDVTRTRELQAERQQVSGELAGAYEELQTTNEELETTNEELQSTIEELETTNEELQSTNEELETMNEELQSTNEELHTINQELALRSAAENQAAAIQDAIVESFAKALVVVDRELRVIVWNSRATELWGLRSEEVMGQHFLTLDIGLPLDRLRSPLRFSLSGDGAAPDVTVDATNRRGRHIRCRVTCQPLRSDGASPSGGAEGVVLVMEEVPA